MYWVTVAQMKVVFHCLCLLVFTTKLPLTVIMMAPRQVCALSGKTSHVAQLSHFASQSNFGKPGSTIFLDTLVAHPGAVPPPPPLHASSSHLVTLSLRDPWAVKKLGGSPIQDLLLLVASTFRPMLGAPGSRLHMCTMPRLTCATHVQSVLCRNLCFRSRRVLAHCIQELVRICMRTASLPSLWQALATKPSPTMMVQVTSRILLERSPGLGLCRAS